MAEFFRRLFSIYNVYCMCVCGVFLALWFHFSRDHQTQTVDPLSRRRHRGEKPFPNISS